MNIERIFTSLKSEVKAGLVIKWSVLMLVAYSMLYIYIKHYSPASGSSAAEQSNSLEWVGFIVLFVGTLMLISFIWDSISNKKRELAVELINICQECLKNKIDNELKLAVDNELKLAEYDLITIEQLLKNVELSLDKDDEVVIYTSLLKTEQDVKDIVVENNKKGVVYKLLYYETWGEIDKNLYNEIIDLTAMGYDKGIDFELSKDTGFDVFIVRRENTKEIEAYFAVNYSVGRKFCMREATHGCKNPCDKENKNLFYKKTDSKVAKAVYERLQEIINTEWRSKTI
jgi:hypothetical protein